MILDYAESDWLASKNYYYNTRTRKISDNINELVDSNHIHFHPEGLCNYLDYGYTVFGQTILDEIKMLEPNMKVSHDENGELIIERLPDPFDGLLNQKSSAEEALSALSDCINDWVEKQSDTIILPLSGGFDSRLMLSMIKEKEKVHAFTYGISEKQEESYEVVYAKAVACHFNVRWNQIELKDYPHYMEAWNKLFGVTTHAHGMYHMEFYRKIKEYVGKGAVLSGILGDVYAGSWRFEPLENFSDLMKLAKNHGLQADSNYCLLKNNHLIASDFYEKNKEKLHDENWRVLTAARMKASLLSYLLRMPENEGFMSWSPFLNAEVVAKMMTLPWEIKDRRKWQVEYFRKNDILVGEWGLKCSKDNVLDHNIFQNYAFEKLDYSYYGDILKKEYIDRINMCIDGGSLVENISELNAWFTLYPIQKLLKRIQDL